MMYMKKYFPFVFLALGLLVICCYPLSAADPATWNIKWNSDASIDETVIISEPNVVIEDKDWQTSHSGQSLVLSRHVDNWQEYSKLGDRLPLELTQKDFWLLKFSSLTMKEATPGSLFEQFNQFRGARLSIEVPGIIRDSSADEKVDSTATWNLSTASPVTLNAVAFDGVILGISLFALGFLIIFIIFASRIRRVNQLIAQEYSLERAAEEFARGDMEEQEE